mgnify:CR=1 FL=1
MSPSPNFTAPANSALLSLCKINDGVVFNVVELSGVTKNLSSPPSLPVADASILAPTYSVFEEFLSILLKDRVQN